MRLERSCPLSLRASNGWHCHEPLTSTPGVESCQRRDHPLPGSRRSAGPGRLQTRIVDGSGPHLTSETQALLRLRLRAAAFILLIGFGVFLVRHVVGVLAGEPLDPLLLGFHILVVLVLGFSSLPLCRQCPVSLRKLRVAELVIFGLPAVFFLLLQHRVTLDDVARGFMPPPMPFWLLLIFTYAMFIPNTWRRAALRDRRHGAGAGPARRRHDAGVSGRSPP